MEGLGWYGFWVTVDFSDTSSDEQEEHNAWTPMLELFFHAHIGRYMEVLVDEKGTGENCTLVSICS